MAHQMATHMWRSHGPVKKQLGKYNKSFSAPWAVAGMLAAFGGGALIGMMGGKKAAMNAEGEGMMAGSRWFGKHHHHGFGSPACRDTHELAAPGAIDETRGERNEGE